MNFKEITLGRLSEIIWYLNAKEIPDKIEAQHYYRYLDIDDPGLKKARMKYRRELKKGGVKIEI